MGRRRSDRAYVMISVVAERFSIHPQTLRLYEREGLLSPARSEGNTRLYDEDAIRRLETILFLTRELGVNLAGVEIVLRLREASGDTAAFDGHLREIRNRLRDERAGIRREGALVKRDGTLPLILRRG